MGLFSKASNFLFKHRIFHQFFILGIIAFATFWLTGGMPLSFILMGPPIYIAYLVKKLAFASLPSTSPINDFAFLLPSTMIYFSFVGFQLSLLAKERGIRKSLSILSLLAFLCYIHFKAWQSLSGYYIVHPHILPE